MDKNSIGIYQVLAVMKLELLKYQNHININF